MEGAAETVIETILEMDGDCVEVAVIVAVPALVGVKTPALVIVPPVAVHVTAEL